MNRTLSRIFVLILFFAASSLALEPVASAQESKKTSAPSEMSEKERDIRRFLKITGAAQLAKQSMTQMIAAYRKSMPQVPARFWDDFEKEADPAELIDLLVPIYDRHLSHEDIEALIEFYESPVGKRYTQALPAITSESQAAGQEWGMKLGQRVMKRLNEEGVR